MAPLRANRLLTCFYCGRKSDVRQTGSIRQFECKRCEAVNYLDQNGEICDPPVATSDEVPVTVQYAQAITRSVSPTSASLHPTAIFCSTCLKNQHLFTASLAQYLPEGDDPSEFRPLDKEYYNFRRGLEERYPQICEECEPKALERMRQAGYAAKTDHLRRLMDKSRSRREKRSSALSYGPLDFVEFIGRYLWYAGLVGQLLWDIVTLVDGYSSKINDSRVFMELTSFSKVLSSLPLYERFWRSVELFFTEGLGHASPPLAKWSLLLSLLSLYWNPKFKEGYRGFVGHISGFLEWYTWQSFSIILRIFLWFCVGRGSFSASDSGPSKAFHIFTLGFVSVVAIVSRRCIKTSMTPLFAQTPEKLHVPVKLQASTADTASPSNMYSALDEILRKPLERVVSARASPTAFGEASPPSFKYDARQVLPFKRNNYSPTSPSSKYSLPARTTPHLTTGDDTMTLAQSNKDADEMDWSPSIPSSHTFNPANNFSYSRNIGNMSQVSPTPKTDLSAFWYKVPPAPMGPARMYRNPPNKSHSTELSSDVNQGAFQAKSRFEGSSGYGPNEKRSLPNRPGKRVNIEFAPPKLFPPALEPDHFDSSAGGKLIDIFERSFTLNDNDVDDEMAVAGNSNFSGLHGLINTVGTIPLVSFLVIFLGITGAIMAKMQ